jgi:hypothetical protein
MKSLTGEHLRELDMAALKFAKASGDPAVFAAAQGVVDSRIRSGYQSALGSAMQAVQMGDLDAAERSIRKANYWIPNGQDIKLSRKDGQLWYHDETGKEVPVTAEALGIRAKMADNPAAAGEYLAKLRHEGATEEYNRAMAELQKSQVKETGRHNLATEANQAQQASSEARRVRELEKSGPVDRFAKYQSGMYDAARAAAEKVSASGGFDMKPEQIIQGTKFVADSVNSFLMPTQKDEYGATTNLPPPQGYEMFFDKNPDGTPSSTPNNNAMLATSLGGTLWAANQNMAPAMTSQAGLEIVRGLYSPDAQVGVSQANGTITVNVNGAPLTVRATPEIISQLSALAKQPAATTPPRR